MKNYLMAMVCSLALIGCGGGGAAGDNNTSDNLNPQTENQIVDDASIDENGSEENSEEESNQIVGYVIDSAVEGLKYRCGDIVGYTNPEGKFACNTFPIAFYVGSIKLGSIMSLHDDQQVFPQDILKLRRDNFNSEVIKLAEFLQSLDGDFNASNGIKILLATLQEFLDDSEMLLIDLNLTELEERHPGIRFISSVLAEEHLRASLGLQRSNEIVQEEDQNSTEGSEESNSSTDQTIDESEDNGTVVEDNNDTTDENSTTSSDDTTNPIVYDLELPEAYHYPVINNSGESIESQLDGYRIVLYSTYAERADQQSNHHGIAVSINSTYAPLMSIQSTYKGKMILVAVYDEQDRLIAISDEIKVADPAPMVIKLII